MERVAGSHLDSEELDEGQEVDIASILGVEDLDLGKVSRSARKGRGHRGDWRSVGDDGEAEKRSKRARSESEDMVPTRQAGWESVKVEMACEGIKVACDLTTNCNAVSCTKSTQDGSRFTIKHAAVYLQGAVEKWARASTAGECSVHEIPAMGVSCVEQLIPAKALRGRRRAALVGRAPRAPRGLGAPDGVRVRASCPSRGTHRRRLRQWGKGPRGRAPAPQRGGFWRGRPHLVRPSCRKRSWATRAIARTGSCFAARGMIE